MRLKKLKLRSLATPFRNRDVEIDFEALGPGLISFVGGNGQGKTTLLAASGPLPLYRTVPSYGYGMVNHIAPGVKDARCELTFSLDGEDYTAMVQADPSALGGKGKTEAFLYKGDTPMAGPRVKEFDEAILSILPSKRTFLASVFSAQGGEGSFLSMSKAERKEAFAEWLNLGALKELADRATARRRYLEADLAKVDAKLELYDDAPDTEALEVELATKEVRIKSLTGKLEHKEKELAETDAHLAEKREAHDEMVVVGGRWEALNSRSSSAKATIADLEGKLEVSHEWSGPPPAEELEKVQEVYRANHEARTKLEKELEKAGYENEELGRSRTRLRQDWEALAKQQKEARAIHTRLSELPGIVKKRVAAEAEVEKSTAAIAAAQQKLKEVRELINEGKVARQKANSALETSTELMTRITPEVCGPCPIRAAAEKADAEAKEATAALHAVIAKVKALPSEAELEEQIKALKLEGEKWTGLTLEWGTAQARMETVAESAPDPDEIQERLEAIRGDGEEAKAKMEAIAVKRAELTGKLGPLEEQAKVLRDRSEAIKARFVEYEGYVKAKEAHRVHQDAMVAAKAMLVAADEELVKLCYRPALLAELKGELVHLEKSRAELVLDDRDCRQSLAEQTSTANEVRGSLERAKAQAALKAELERERKRQGDAHGACSVLATGLGVDGVQALMIDAAGPELSTTVNDLLHAAFDSRFSIKIVTTEPKKSTEGFKEVFDVKVLDALTGREANQLSGGETVIVEECLRLGLALFNTKRSGHRIETLWRDECTGALSPENASSYVRMLRRAMEIGGFHQAIFIAHQPEVWSQSDVTLNVRGGSVFRQ